MYNNELYHWGVLGMKWGVRRDRKGSSSVVTKSKNKKSDSENTIDEDTTKKVYNSAKSGTKKVTRSLQKQSLKDMSDEEIQTKINRLKLENQYLDSKDSVSSKTRSKGKSFALKCMERIGENVVVNLGTQAANHAIGVAINKTFKVDSSDANARIVNPQKGQSDKK